MENASYCKTCRFGCLEPICELWGDLRMRMSSYWHFERFCTHWNAWEILQASRVMSNKSNTVMAYGTKSILFLLSFLLSLFTFAIGTLILVLKVMRIMMKIKWLRTLWSVWRLMILHMGSGSLCDRFIEVKETKTPKNCGNYIISGAVLTIQSITRGRFVIFFSFLVFFFGKWCEQISNLLKLLLYFGSLISGP